MSLEDEVKEAFRKHGEDARPDQRSWNAVEKKVRRAHKQRLVYSSALSLVIVGAIAAVVTLSPRAKESKGFSNPTATPTGIPSSSPSVSRSPQSSVFPGDLHANYRDDVQGWAISYAEDWKESRFEGVTEFSPPGMPSPERGGPTFWVAVSILDGRPPSKRNSPATDTTGFDERNGGVTVSGSSGGGHRQVYLYDWTGLCISTDECPAGPATLQVVVEGSTSALWSKYHETSDGMLRTLQIAKGSGSIGDVHTRYGIVSQPGSSYDALTVTLVRFLDARVEQANAEAFMSSQAKKDFANAANCLFLYTSSTTHDLWTSYQVLSRFDANGQATFYASMSSGTNGGYLESIVVAKEAGSSTPIILRGKPSCSNTAD